MTAELCGWSGRIDGPGLRSQRSLPAGNREQPQLIITTQSSHQRTLIRPAGCGHVRGDQCPFDKPYLRKQPLNLGLIQVSDKHSPVLITSYAFDPPRSGSGSASRLSRSPSGRGTVRTSYLKVYAECIHGRQGGATRRIREVTKP